MLSEQLGHEALVFVPAWYGGQSVWSDVVVVAKLVLKAVDAVENRRKGG